MRVQDRFDCVGGKAADVLTEPPGPLCMPLRHRRRPIAGVGTEQRQGLAGRQAVAQGELGKLALQPAQRREQQAQPRAGAQREFADALGQHGQYRASDQRHAVAPALRGIGLVDVAKQAPVLRQHEAPAEPEPARRAAEQGLVMHLRLDRCVRPIAVQQHHLQLAHTQHSTQRCQIEWPQRSCSCFVHHTIGHDSGSPL
ncbi:hypothetical protein [uncultured Stenotrophomonas sp.]|uniref:hypothetical protein n=1 Tax=uncultured Stenotrophomonas sp. TaxID=165438 RepID=UPI0028D1D14D|nr:hypothetical protein [uncultured Stenotrophomonas sp.]